MKCLVTGVNVKVLAKAIHTLCRIGDELYIEPDVDGLSLKTVNSSRSAYAIFKFDSNFFSSYSNISENTMGSRDTPENVIRCKLPMKSILTVFRSMNFVEKNVESCKISLPWIEALLTFELKCRHNITKTYNLRYQDTDALEPVITMAAAPNVISCSAKLCCEALMNFHSGVDEITWKVLAEKVCITNFIDDNEDPTKAVHTELTLDKDEFDQLSISSDTEVTFALKDLKAIAAFAEPNGAIVSLQIETAGRPILISLSNTPTFKADFLMATLSPALGTSSASSSARNTPRSVLRGNRSRVGNTPVASLTVRETRTPVTVRQNRRLAEEEMEVEVPPLCPPELPEAEPMDEAAERPPPSKRIRVRRMFQRCFDSSFDPAKVPGSEYVYAPDSDEEKSRTSRYLNNTSSHVNASNPVLS